MTAADTRRSESLLAERRTSPGLLLALVGAEAMQRLRAAHAALDLSPRRFQLLALLHDNGPMSQRDLGEVMAVDPSVLVQFLNPLEADGHLTRRREANDRRRHVVSLTPAGERHLAAAAEAQRRAEDELFTALSDGQRKRLATLLLAIQESLDKEPPCLETTPDSTTGPKRDQT